MFKKIIKNLIFVAAVFSWNALAIDQAAIEKHLSTTGLVVEIHGSVPDSDLFVITTRNEENFFDFTHMSAVVDLPEIRKDFSLLKRHDSIRVWGEMLKIPSPQIHVRVQKFEVLKKFTGHPGSHAYSADFPQELSAKTSAEFLVHNVSAEGRVVVLEYKNHVLPLFVKPAQAIFTKDLARNDVVRIAYKVELTEGQPPHLRLASEVESPVVVLESILALHGKDADVEGELVLFPKSPQIMFNVFAVFEHLPYGLSRQYTIVNFDDQDEFKKIREKLDAAWATDPTAFTNGRNKLVHTKLRVRVKGVFNIVDANQANVQILPKSVNDVEVK